jgi:hypothetical protein
VVRERGVGEEVWRCYSGGLSKSIAGEGSALAVEWEAAVVTLVRRLRWGVVSGDRVTGEV